jgi:hypothetical protein
MRRRHDVTSSTRKAIAAHSGRVRDSKLKVPAVAAAPKTAKPISARDSAPRSRNPELPRPGRAR